MSEILPHHAWFPEARFGLFIHWGPYALFGRGEQVLLRERMPRAEYEAAARAAAPDGSKRRFHYLWRWDETVPQANRAPENEISIMAKK